MTADEARIAAGDRAHLRDHEQRREDADEDDQRHHAAPQDAVARRRLRRQVAPHASRSIERRRGRDRRHDQTTAAEHGACGARTASELRLVETAGGFRPAKPSSSAVPVARSRPRRPASRAAPRSPSRSAGKSTRPRSRSFTSTPSRWSRSTQLGHRRRRALDLRLRAPRGSAGRSPPPLPAIRATSCAALDAPPSARACARPAASASRANLGKELVRLLGREVALAPSEYHRAPSCAPVNEYVSRATALRELAAARARNPAPGIFLWSRAAIWAAALFAFLVFEPNRHPRAGALGRPAAHARPRLRSPTSGRAGTASGSCGSPSTATTRPPGGGGLLPALPAHVAAARPRPRRPLRARRDRRLARGGARRRSCSSTGSRRSGSAPTGARRAVLYLAVFPMALFLRRSTASRSTSCSRSPPSCSRSGGGSSAPARSRGSRS